MSVFLVSSKKKRGEGEKNEERLRANRKRKESFLIGARVGRLRASDCDAWSCSAFVVVRRWHIERERIHSRMRTRAGAEGEERAKTPRWRLIVECFLSFFPGSSTSLFGALSSGVEEFTTTLASARWFSSQPRRENPHRSRGLNRRARRLVAERPQISRRRRRRSVDWLPFYSPPSSRRKKVATDSAPTRYGPLLLMQLPRFQ